MIRLRKIVQRLTTNTANETVKAAPCLKGVKSELTADKLELSVTKAQEALKEKSQEMIDTSMIKMKRLNRPKKTLFTRIKHTIKDQIELMKDDFCIAIGIIKTEVQNPIRTIKRAAAIRKEVKLSKPLFETNDPGKIKELVRKGLNINAQNAKGLTKLCYANTVDEAKFLMKNGANIFVPLRFQTYVGKDAEHVKIWQPLANIFDVLEHRYSQSSGEQAKDLKELISYLRGVAETQTNSRKILHRHNLPQR